MTLQRPILQMIRLRPCCCGWPGARGCTVRQASGQSAGATCGHCWPLPGRIPKASAVQPGRHGSQMRRTRPMPMPATGCAVRHCLHCRAPTAQRWKTLPASARRRPARMPILPGRPKSCFLLHVWMRHRRHQKPGSLHGVAAGPTFRCGCAYFGSSHVFADGSRA